MLLMLCSRGNSRKRADLLRKWKIFHHYGFGGLYQPFNLPSEPKLVSIGNNVSISANVRFITHDVIQSMLQTMDNPDYPAGRNGFYMGKIEVLDNVVIGANATILYNTKIGPNALVAAGSVVVKDVPEGAIVGGNPAKVIGSLSDLAKRRASAEDKRPDDRNDEVALDEYFLGEHSFKEIMGDVMKMIDYIIQYIMPTGYRIKHLRNKGLRIGNGCEIYRSVNFGSEPYLISIGNDVRITSGVKFCTHDGGIWTLRKKGLLQDADIFGQITIGDRVHIGWNSIIMPNVHVGNDCIIGCGSVVTKDIPDGMIVAGVPAKIIKSVDDYYEKAKKISVPTAKMSEKEKRRYIEQKLEIIKK